MSTCRCIRIWERRRLLHSFIKNTGPLLIVDKVVPTEIYTAHNLKKNRDFLLGFPWEHPSFKMGLVFPFVTNCPVASSACAQDIRICAYFSISFPEAAILGRYFIYDSYSQVIQDTQVGQDTEASQVPRYTRRKTAQKKSIYRYTIGIIYEIPTHPFALPLDKATRTLGMRCRPHKSSHLREVRKAICIRCIFSDRRN